MADPVPSLRDHFEIPFGMALAPLYDTYGDAVPFARVLCEVVAS